MDQRDVNDREWHDPANWTGAVFPRYASERDTRLWVPKRNPALGSTLNFAHPASMRWLVGLLLVPAAIALGAIVAAGRHLQHR
jgi:uncharacterized membrane protein